MARQRRRFSLIRAVGMLAVLAGAALPGIDAAVPQPSFRHAERFVGVIRMMPRDGVGTWLIGTTTITTGSTTFLDDAQGSLAVGTCARVEMRRENVLRITRLKLAGC